MESGCSRIASGLRKIVFVADIAYKLFGHIFKGNDAVSSAVLIDNYGQMDAALAEQADAGEYF